MNFELNNLFSLLIGAAALVGWIKYRKAQKVFLPFLLLLTAGFINEITSLIVIRAGFSNAANYNVYLIAEALLVNWQFRRFSIFQRSRQYYFLQVFISIAWILESFVFSTLHTFNSFFIILDAFIIVLLSIHTISQMLFYEDHRLLSNSKFLVCLGFLVFFIYAMLVEIYWVTGLHHSKHYRVNILQILMYINLLTNLIYLLAVLWMPMRRLYIMRS